LQKLEDKVAVVISNNASDDGTKEYLDGIKSPLVTVVHQETNLGLIGNYRFLINSCVTDYIWVVSDDDFIEDNTIATVLEHVVAKQAGLIHLAWGTAKLCGDELRVVIPGFYGMSALLLPEEGHGACLRLANIDGGGLMFFTANILHAQSAKEALARFSGRADNLAVSIWVACYCSWRRGFIFEKRRCVLGTHDVPRWSALHLRVYFSDMPRVYQELVRIGEKRFVIFRKHVQWISGALIKCIKTEPGRSLQVWGLMPFRLFRFPFKPVRSLDVQ